MGFSGDGMSHSLQLLHNTHTRMLNHKCLVHGGACSNTGTHRSLHSSNVKIKREDHPAAHPCTHTEDSSSHEMFVPSS